MTVSSKIKVKFLPVIGGDHTSVAIVYVAVGSPISNPVQSMIIVSTYDTPVFLSVDGINDHVFVPSGSIINIDFGSNKEGTAKFTLPIGTQFFLKEGPDSLPASGDLFMSFIYGG